MQYKKPPCNEAVFVCKGKAPARGRGWTLLLGLAVLCDFSQVQVQLIAFMAGHFGPVGEAEIKFGSVDGSAGIEELELPIG